jgi:transcriptional regulator with XRE-family HTH domain
MPTVRSLRLSRGMTVVELALQVGIPARTLGAIEYGLLSLDLDSRARLAGAFNIMPDLLRAADRAWPPPAAPDRISGLRRAAPSVAVMLISGLLLTQLPLNYRLPAADPLDYAQILLRPPTAPAAAPRDLRPQYTLAHPQPIRHAAPAQPTRTPTRPTPLAPTPPAPSPTPAFTLGADGPHGCPLIATGGWIVITQGYGEGTHAPAAIWGALDLAIDGDGDGIPEPDTTDGIRIVATHGGVAHVFPDSWPGGNFVLVENKQDGWSTAYAHLGSIAVANEQAVSAGTPLGTVGSTGMATGPHLHYEVRHGGVNIDPTGLIGCDQPRR